MIIAAEVKRDEQGYWTHPALVRSGCETSAELSYWLRTHKLQCFVMTMRDEAPEAFAAGFTYEAPDARGWIPEPPDDDGWFLGSVHDTGDGPVCYWFRHTGFVNGMVASHLLCHSGTINRHSLNGALLS